MVQEQAPVQAEIHPELPGDRVLVPHMEILLDKQADREQDRVGPTTQTPLTIRRDPREVKERIGEVLKVPQEIQSLVRGAVILPVKRVDLVRAQDGPTTQTPLTIRRDPREVKERIGEVLKVPQEIQSLVRGAVILPVKQVVLDAEQILQDQQAALVAEGADKFLAG